MKTSIITISILVIVFIITQAFITSSTNRTENYKYELIKRIENLEIRKYKSAKFSSVTLQGTTYKETSGKGFRILANYIFGGNKNNEKIAMTSPVAMNISDSTTMMFMIPSSYKIEDLPQPNNQEISFITEPEKYMAAIRFGGYANDEKINKYQAELIELLEKNNIKHFNNFSYFGYNPPYEVINRRNEILVEVDINSLSY